MSSPTLIKSYKAGAAVGANLLVKFDSVDLTVIKAAAATDLIIGASMEIAADAAGDRIDVAMSGIANVIAGGTITRGAKVTADSAGKAVAAAPSAGANAHVAGVCLYGAASGDLTPILLAPSVMQG